MLANPRFHTPTHPQTEAVFDPATDEWVINTPDDAAIKWWIGNAAEDGQAATVFARLKLPSTGAGGGGLVDHGVHAFVVPIRAGGRGPEATLPGVQILDCGYKVRRREEREKERRVDGKKDTFFFRRSFPCLLISPAFTHPTPHPRHTSTPQVGLQGVDNGALRFTNVHVPRDHLLDRFASVDAAGVYTSSLSPGKRFASTLGELTGGRVGLTGSSVAVLKAAVTIAVRYGATRAQFGPPGGPEVVVLDYPSQQVRLGGKERERKEGRHTAATC